MKNEAGRQKETKEYNWGRIMVEQDPCTEERGKETNGDKWRTTGRQVANMAGRQKETSRKQVGNKRETSRGQETRTKHRVSWWNRIPVLRKESGKRRQAEDKAQTRS